MNKQEIQNLAKTQLDRIWAILTQAAEVHKNSIGKIGEQFAYDNAMKINAEYEATKSAYKAIGITGQIGIHNIKAGA